MVVVPGWEVAHEPRKLEHFTRQRRRVASSTYNTRVFQVAMGTTRLHATMPPRTRSGNQDANFKVYYSKKVVQQVHFPHKRKTVRRPSSPLRGDSGQRQMVFLPEKMKVRIVEAVRDSDEETEDEEMEVENTATKEQAGHGSKSTTARDRARDSKKRGSDLGLQSGSEEEKSGPSTSKRRRTAATVKTERTLRRQSTMTQLVDGRRPLSDAEEPDFKPVKRDSRLSWGGKGQNRSKDKQQRTLTQMIPDMRPLEIMSDEDIENALSDIEVSDGDSQAYDLAVAQRLAVQGSLQDTNPSVDANPDLRNVQPPAVTVKVDEAELPIVVVQSVEDAIDGFEEESYRPTQYIDTSNSRPRRTTRPSTNVGAAVGIPDIASSSTARGAPKVRFSLLNTPEKRRVREIPSSQSPADSPLFTQVSPKKFRPPLYHSSGNSVRAPETPSKRKRAAFKEPSAPPILKKFESTIQDSEDEDDAIEEDTIEPATLRGRSEPSPELGELHTHVKTAKIIPGEQAPEPMSEHLNDHGDEPATCPASVPHLQSHDEDSNGPALTSIEAPLPHPADCLRSTPPSNDTDHQETFPSTPMVIQSNSSDDELEEDRTPFHQISQNGFQPDSVDVQHTADLDGEPIQVPERSPSAQHETQQSHSSRAEQQLQSEWFSYSQYVNTQLPTSSSMFVVHDPSSYGITQSLQRNTAQQTHSTAHPPSQATTLDEVTQRTPSKKRTQHIASANITPRSIASSQPVMSPSKPPPLFIPSSFPSPDKARMQDWSSSLYGRTQDALRSSQFGMSLEDFSIPLPPPVEDEWGNEE